MLTIPTRYCDGGTQCWPIEKQRLCLAYHRHINVLFLLSATNGLHDDRSDARETLPEDQQTAPILQYELSRIALTQKKLDTGEDNRTSSRHRSHMRYWNSGGSFFYDENGMLQWDNHKKLIDSLENSRTVPSRLVNDGGSDWDRDSGSCIRGVDPQQLKGR